MAGKDRRPPFDRALDKVEKHSDTGCWIWQARVSSTGCPLLWVHEKDGDLSATRIIYEHEKGAIPEGMRLWHTCGNRRCVNPDHMEPLRPFESMTRSAKSPSVQNRMKTHCPQGHAYSGDNLKLDKAGRNRLCRACRNERSRIAMRRKYEEMVKRRGRLAS